MRNCYLVNLALPKLFALDILVGAVLEQCESALSDIIIMPVGQYPIMKVTMGLYTNLEVSP